MTSATLFPNAPEISADDYCVFGLATCFAREEGEVKQIQVIEPIPCSYLEALLKGVPTSYEWVCAKPLGEIITSDSLQKTSDFPAQAQFAENFVERTVAASRTYKSRPEAQAHIPLHTSRKDFNFSLERKRVLNVENIVNTEDNVKQHAYTHQVL